MISPKTFHAMLSRRGVSFYAGVPDSLLKDFCAYVADAARPGSHVIAANEGNAVALAAGHFLATGNSGLVYMQNSGLGNSVNPLVSLADARVYGIPILLLIGWRGEPGVKDEPQHVKQGNITLDLLKTLGITHTVLPQTEREVQKAITKAMSHMRASSEPYAIVVRKGTFAKYSPKKATLAPAGAEMLREQAIEIIMQQFGSEDIIVSTTGKTSRELFELREQYVQGHEKDFLTVGSMGHSSQIALGIALSKPHRVVYCLDGDGAVIMHMGALATIGSIAPKNFKHIVLNNGAHESVGGQPTAGLGMDISAIARASGYTKVFQARDEKSLKRALDAIKKSTGPLLLEVFIQQGSRKDLGRPTSSPKQNKELFMDFVRKGSRALTVQARLERFLKEHRAKRVFLVSGRKSFVQSGARTMFKGVLSKYDVTVFNDFGANPVLEDIERGIKAFKKRTQDAVVAIGGGSAIDTAKLINALASQRGSALPFIRGRKVLQKRGKPLAAIPTTSGSGSEATQFAVVYVNGIKHSLEHSFILPDAAIIEPKLTMSMPAPLAAATGMDALAQAIEAYWSVHSTDESRRYARRAISLILDNLEQSVDKPTRTSRQAMAIAAHLAGKAINIAKTTAAHALSYVFTSRFDIPHGHAVGLMLGPVFAHNAGVVGRDVADSRGLAYVVETMAELQRLLGVSSSSAAVRKFERIMKKIGLETRLSKLGIKKSDVAAIASAVNADRLKNNPRAFSKQALEQAIHSII